MSKDNVGIFEKLAKCQENHNYREQLRTKTATEMRGIVLRASKGKHSQGVYKTLQMTSGRLCSEAWLEH